MGKKRQKSTVGVGVFFMLLGAFFYALSSGLFKGEPGNLFMVFTGGLFLALYLLTKLEWAVYPGSFILTSGVVVYMASQGMDLNVYWPAFILLPGLGFILIVILTPHNRWALVPGFCIIAIAIYFFVINIGLMPDNISMYASYLPPAAFVIIGFKLVLFPRK